MEADQGERQAHERKHHTTSCMGWALAGRHEMVQRLTARSCHPEGKRAEGLPVERRLTCLGDVIQQHAEASVSDSFKRQSSRGRVSE